MGKQIGNIREILKGANIVCGECLNNNISASHAPFESKENNTICYNQEMICKDCGKEFIFTVEKDSKDYNLFKSVFGMDLLKVNDKVYVKENPKIEGIVTIVDILPYYSVRIKVTKGSTPVTDYRGKDLEKIIE